MSRILDYSGPNHSTFSPGIGYGIIIVINLVSLVLIARIPIATHLIGGAYEPLIGLFVGIPYTLGQLGFGTFPAISYFSRFS